MDLHLTTSTARQAPQVMVIDDEPTQRLAVTLMCRALGLPPVLEFSDAGTALAELASKTVSVDLVICDLDMPDVDGMEFIRRLADIPEPPAMMIVSGHPTGLLDSVEGLGRAHGLRMMHSVRKPLTKNALSGVLDTLATQARPAAGRLPGAHGGPVDDPAEHDALMEAGTFEPYFQPQISLETGAVHGAEVLARLVLPDGSVFQPRALLDRLAERQMMACFTVQLIDKILISVAQWPEGLKALQLSINLTPVLFEDMAIMHNVMDRINRAGLPHNKIVFELVETAVSRDPTTIMEGAARLRLRGYGLSIDDFGQGHSTLDQLRRLPFTELKIDRAFVTDIDTDPNNQAIVSNTISMAKALDMTVVAEGVETAAQAQYLAELGCHVAQGYYYSRALPLDAFLRFLDTRAQA